MGSKKAIINDWVEAGIITVAQAQTMELAPTGSAMNVGTGSAVADVTGTAGGTYTATEQGIINDTATQLNALLAELRTLGIIST